MLQALLQALLQAMLQALPFNKTQGMYLVIQLLLIV